MRRANKTELNQLLRTDAAAHAPLRCSPCPPRTPKNSNGSEFIVI